MSMTVAPASSSGIGGAARVLFTRNEELDKVNQDLDHFETRLHDTEDQLRMPRADRLSMCNRTIYNACWEQSTAIHKKLGFGLAIGTLFAGAVGAAAVTLTTGNSQLAGLIALAGLVLPFKGVPEAYAGIVKKWILPRQMDPLVVAGLERERDGLKAAVDTLRTRKTGIESAMSAQVAQALEAANAAPVPSIQVEEAYVVIGGTRVPVRRPTA